MGSRLWGQILQYHFSSSPSIILIKIGTTNPIFSMVYLSILRGLALVRLSIVMPKASTIWLRKSSDTIGFQLKVT